MRKRKGWKAVKGDKKLHSRIPNPIQSCKIHKSIKDYDRKKGKKVDE